MYPARVFRLAFPLLPNEASCLFPIRQGQQFIQNCLQSLEPPFMLSSRCIGFPSLLQVNLIGCTDFGYFLPQVPNALLDRFLH
jgi:hypothetical protein